MLPDTKIRMLNVLLSNVVLFLGAPIDQNVKLNLSLSSFEEEAVIAPLGTQDW